MMAIDGPFLSGGVARNNQFTANIVPTANIPAGAMIWIIGGTNVADTADVMVTDTAGNAYVNQAFVGLPGVQGSILVSVARNALAVPTTGSITMTSSIRGNWDLNCVHHTGAEGSIFSTDVRLSDVAITNPAANVVGRPGMALFGMLAVAGPSTDAFTNDPNWGADQKGNIARSNVTVHAAGRSVPTNAQDMQTYSYAPILGTARRTLIFAASFQ